jgi:hypothetical protein
MKDALGHGSNARDAATAARRQKKAAFEEKQHRSKYHA